MDNIDNIIIFPALMAKRYASNPVDRIVGWLPSLVAVPYPYTWRRSRKKMRGYDFPTIYLPTNVNIWLFNTLASVMGVSLLKF